MTSTSEQEIIEIIQGDKRFAVISKYDPILIQYFKTMDKRHYNAEKHEWTFPCEHLKAFETYLKTKMITYNKTWTKNLAKLEITSSNLELSFNSYIKDFNIFKQIDGAIYDRNISKWKLPLSKQMEVEDLLQKYKFTYVVVNKEENQMPEDMSEEEELKQDICQEDLRDDESQKILEKVNDNKRPIKKQGGKTAKKVNLDL
jgi:hypothetical protein